MTLDLGVVRVKITALVFRLPAITNLGKRHQWRIRGWIVWGGCRWVRPRIDRGDLDQLYCGPLRGYRV